MAENEKLSPIDIAINSLNDILSPDLKIQIRSQFENKFDPNSKYACLFTCNLMLFSARRGKALGFQAYKDACIKAGAIEEDFYVLNGAKMAIAAGFPDLKYKTSPTGPNTMGQIMKLIQRRIPVIISLNSKHYELVTGYDYPDGKLFFEVNDPNFSGQTLCAGANLQMFRVINGTRTAAKDSAGKYRYVTHISWFE